MNPLKLVIAALVVIVVVGLFAWSALRPAEVDVAEVRRGPIRSFVEEEGRTRVADRYEVSAPVSGRLLRLTVEERDRVTKGDVVAEIDPLQFKSRVRQAEAQIAALRHRLEGVDRQRPKEEEILRSKSLEGQAEENRKVAARRLAEAEAAAGQAKREAERARKLGADGTITRSEMEAAVLAEVRAEENLKALGELYELRRIEQETAALGTRILEASAGDVDWQEGDYREQIAEVSARLEVLSDDLGRTKVVAPATGLVLNRYLESETVVSAGTAILSVGSLTRMEVEADLLSEDATRMKPGMVVEVFGRALGDRVIEGRLQRIYPSAFKKISSLGVEQQRVTVVVDFDPAGTGLGDRYRVDVRVILDAREDAVLVPESALFRSEGEWRAFRLDGGRARMVAVTTGLRDGRRREVLSGLRAGDQVIVHPAPDLADGARATPRK